MELSVHVYISRLLLYMIAHPAIRLMLSRLRPPHGALPLPVDQLPAYPPTFLSHGTENVTPFSLEGVLKSVEHLGYRAEPQPGGLALTLKPYQQQALSWMLDMEALPRGINGLFWEERPFADGGSFFYSPALGEMRMARPPMMHGGLLCDEMASCQQLEVDLTPSASPATCSPQMLTLFLATRRFDALQRAGAGQDARGRLPRRVDAPRSR